MSAVATPSAAPSPVKPLSLPAPERYVSLDAYRGLIMIVLVSGLFGLRTMIGHPFWHPVAEQLEHVKWEGIRFYDLIQPAFIFMAGVAVPFAMAKRIEKGFGFGRNLLHVLVRALKLVLIAQLFTVVHRQQVRLGFINVLNQIALAYVVCFLLMRLPVRWQVAACAALLIGHTALFFAFPGPDGPFSMTGNIGQEIDRAVLGYVYDGNYATINFITSAVNMMLGVWTGYIMMSRRDMREKIKLVAGVATAAIVLGYAISPAVPIIKRIGTASFNLAATGMVMFGMLACVWLVEIKGYKKLVFPLVVVGVNSIFIYVVSQLFKGGIFRAIGVIAGNFEWLGAYSGVAHWTATLAVMWYFCYWLYRRNIYFKV
jgi:heparan-alpha-glucosaminide N-acetyltransferase